MRAKCKLTDLKQIFFLLFLADMEAITERRAFDKVMRNLEGIGNILKLCCEVCGGVDANSLNRVKSLANELDEIESPDEYLDGFISDWIRVVPDFKGFLPLWAKRVCALYDPRKRGQYVKFMPEQLRVDYIAINDTYERWRNSIILWLSRQLGEGETIDDANGTIYVKDVPKMAALKWMEEPQKQGFEKLIAAGLISIDGNKCKWHGESKALLAYAMEKIFCKSNMKGEFPETKLNEMFGVKRLGQTRAQLYNNKNGMPRGANRIDELGF